MTNFRTLLLIILIVGVNACTENTATIKEHLKPFSTYSFSDPNAIPDPGNTPYPYFRYDGYSKEAEQKDWKVIELENPYVKVHILPEIGGKIWGAIEKSTSNEFIYYNSVVKFRNIAMRGPWTSGGIEFNFGIIGHSPTVSTPVDYSIRENDDGSVSCFIGAIDLMTRTRWETEINLQPDKAYFTTHTRWSNPTALLQPYYQWSNAAYQAAGDLEFIFPGAYRISHGGSAGSWPIDEDERDLSFYEKNNFGGSKSNHIVGSIDGFYGAYWHDLNFGSGHYSMYGDKLGGKIFLWSLSRSGGIWESLLTDTDGQYVELQSGRLYNQASSGSTHTPFKHFGFAPHSSDEFREYWYPVMDIGGIVASNHTGALNVIKNASEQTIAFSPLQSLNDDIKIYFGDELQNSFRVNIKPLEVWEKSIENNPEDKPLRIIVGENSLIYSEEASLSSRPVKAPVDFDRNSVFGLFTEGLNWVYQGYFDRAYEKFSACLEKDPLYVPALNHLAELQFRKADYDKALSNIKKSLSVNTYDAKANFIFGLLSRHQKNYTDAQDGFAVASISPEYRVAAYLELGKLFILKNELHTAQHYAEKVLAKEADNQDALLLMAIVSRKKGQTKKAAEYLEQIESISPLNHFSRAERLFLNPNEQTTKALSASVTNELPYQTFMEMALWYAYIGANEEALKLLEISPENALIDLQSAYLCHKLDKQEESDICFEKFVQSTSDFVLPFRQELGPILEWAVHKTKDWKASYYLALLEWNSGNKEAAKRLFKACEQAPESPYFYLAKSRLLGNEEGYNPEQDLLKAKELGEKDWRTSLTLIEFYLRDGSVKKALKISEEALKTFPSNDALKYTQAKCLLANKLYAECLTKLENTTILPFEGAQYGRITYRQAAIMESIRLFEMQQFDEAIERIEKAKLWPENLGVGRPYEVDERIEDFLKAECLLRLGKKDQALELYDEIVAYSRKHNSRYSSTDFLFLVTLKRLNKDKEVNQFMANWLEEKPNDPLLKWSKAMLNNNKPGAKAIEEQINTETGGTPWDPRYADTEFELIKEVFEYIGINSFIPD